MGLQTLLLLGLLTAIKGDLNQCILDWEGIIGASSQLFSLDRSPYGDMFAFSGHWINDLGRFSKCKNLAGTQFVVFEIAPRPWVVFALCGPISCTKSDYYSLLQDAEGVELFNSIVNTTDPIEGIRPILTASPTLGSIVVHFPYEYINEHAKVHGGAVAMLIFISVLLAICFLASLLDLWVSLTLSESKLEKAPKGSVEDNPPTDSSVSFASWSVLIQTILCFSLVTNFKKLFQGPIVSRSGDSFPLLNGIRVLSMGWVIVGHVYSNRVGSTPLINLTDIPEMADKPKIAIIYGAFYAVDTFFWLSGFLVSYMLVQELREKGRWNWFMVYFHRAWRISPLFMFITFLIWAFEGYLGSGPMWFQNDGSSLGCDDYWWANLLFINNFIPNGTRTLCVSVSWYLANDMQFFAISPVIVYLYVKVQKVYGWIIIAFLCLVSVVVSWEIAREYHLNNVFIAPNNTDYMTYYYVKPYCRVAPYVLGMACGFIMYELRQYEKRMEVYDSIAHFLGKAIEYSRIAAWGAFAAGLGLICFLIWIQYTAWKPGQIDFATWTEAENYQFIAWNRLGYGVGLSLLLLPVLLGYIQPAVWFLSLPIWSPIAKLTFSVYLIHVTIITTLCVGSENAFYFGDLQVLMDIVAFTVLSYIVAFTITLTVESPLMALEKVLFRRPQRKEGKTIE